MQEGQTSPVVSDGREVLIGKWHVTSDSGGGILGVLGWGSWSGWSGWSGWSDWSGCSGRDGWMDGRKAREARSLLLYLWKGVLIGVIRDQRSAT